MVHSMGDNYSLKPSTEMNTASVLHSCKKSNVNSAPGPLNCVYSYAGSVADVSEVQTASILRVEVSRMGWVYGVPLCMSSPWSYVITDFLILCLLIIVDSTAGSVNCVNVSSMYLWNVVILSSSTQCKDPRAESTSTSSKKSNVAEYSDPYEMES
jgi:hypothetical protein